jgi:hypothetical protein
MDALSNLNWLHILVATLAYYAIGAIWYSFLFQRQWIRHHNIDMSNPDAKKGVGAIMSLGFILNFLITTGLAILIYRAGINSGVISGVKLGSTTGILFSAAAISMTYLYLKKPAPLHFIDGLYHVVGQIVASIILCVWQ